MLTNVNIQEAIAATTEATLSARLPGARFRLDCAGLGRIARADELREARRNQKLIAELVERLVEHLTRPGIGMPLGFRQGDFLAGLQQTGIRMGDDGGAAPEHAGLKLPKLERLVKCSPVINLSVGVGVLRKIGDDGRTLGELADKRVVDRRELCI